MTIILRETVRETIREIEIQTERRVNRRERRSKSVCVAELDVEMPKLPTPATSGEGR